MWEVAPDGQIIADRFEDDVSLAVKGEKGWSLLLGCAHAGLPNIMQRAKDLFAIERLHMVVGGSHLCGVDPEDYGVWFDRLAEFPVEKWRLNHCTGFKAAAAMLLDSMMLTGPVRAAATYSNSRKGSEK